MKRRPFREKEGKKQRFSAEATEISAMDRLLSHDCTEEEFVLLFVKMLQESTPQIRFEMIDDRSVKAIQPNGSSSTIFTWNAWVSYRDEPEERKETLERHLRVAQGSLEEDEPLQPNQIVAMVKDEEYLSVMGPDHDLATEHICGDLWVVYAQDLPDQVKSLKWGEIENMGIERGALRKLAEENLRHVMPTVEQSDGDSWYLLTAGRVYTASLLLFNELWDDLQSQVAGAIVAVAPSRDVVLFSSVNSQEGLAEIRKRAKEIRAAGNYLVSETLVVRVQGRWEVFNAN